MLDRIRSRAAAGDEDALRILRAVEERDAAEAAAKGAQLIMAAEGFPELESTFAASPTRHETLGTAGGLVLSDAGCGPRA